MINENKVNLVFDLDGTLIDSSKGIFFAYKNAINNSAGSIKNIGFSKFKEYIGPPFEIMIRDIHPKLNKNEISLIIKDFRKIYDTHAFLSYEIYDNIKNCLRDLKKFNYFLYVLSNKKDVPTKIIINKEFPDIFTNIWGKQGKDFDKAEILKGLKINNPNGKNLFIGDTISDFKSSIKADMDFLYASYGFGKINQSDEFIKCEKTIFLKKSIFKYLEN